MLLFSAFLLFVVNWGFLTSDCRNDEKCEVSHLLYQNPFHYQNLSLWTLLKVSYIVLFLVMWISNLILQFNELRGSWYIKQFCQSRLGVSEDHIKWISWSDLVHRLVLVQTNTRLCLRRKLNESHIINRILRKENYLIGMINKGVLCLSVPLPGYKRRLLFTKAMEWSLYWGLLNPMFDENFQIKFHYRTNVEFLKQRFRTLALIWIVFAPFLIVFLLIYFIMKNVEKLYYSPGVFLERCWSPFACWRLREFNELDHQLESRKQLSQRPAQEYLSQFPNFILVHFGQLLSFIFGSFVALLLCVALLDDRLLEHGDLLGHNLVWWVAILHIGLKISRGLISEKAQTEAEQSLEEIIKYTHYYPSREWRGRARSKEIKESVEKLFHLRFWIFLDELASLLLGPYVFYFSLASNAERIVQYLQNYSTRIDGVGDVCSLATFDFEKHGDQNFGSPYIVPEEHQSHEGKMEKSFLTFMETYPKWKPHEQGKEMLHNLQTFVISSFHELQRTSTSSGNNSKFENASCQRSQSMSVELSSLSRLNTPEATVQNSTQDAGYVLSASVRGNGLNEGDQSTEQRNSSYLTALEQFHINRSSGSHSVHSRAAVQESQDQD
eukprot:g2186.t1